MPCLTGLKSGTPHHALYWRFDKQSAVRMGDWKLSKHEEFGVRLHNLASDPGEKTDLSAQDPEKVKELQAVWDKWNAGNAKPLWPSKTDAPWTNTDW
jgi:arylsulfatase A-like enzyme